MKIFQMKQRIYLITLLVAAALCTGCGKEKAENNSSIAESYTRNAESNASESDALNAENNTVGNGALNGSNAAEGDNTPSEEPTASKSDTSNDIVWNDKLENSDSFDFTYDYSEQIKADVDYMVSTSSSLQEELENIDKIIEKYNPLAEAAQTQGEMNVASGWFYTIWDTELNSLWSRFTNIADEHTKDTVLTEQRNWISMKEEVILLSIGTRDENGSMYPLLQNSLLEDITKNRSYVIAKKLADLNGEAFVLPETSSKYGIFVDNEGTGDVYSSLITRQSFDGNEEAVISIYRQGEITGTFTDNGNGELAFTSDDESIKGIIQINGWDGASFRITEDADGSPFTTGEEFLFPIAF